jgi:hypothetical protein
MKMQDDIFVERSLRLENGSYDFINFGTIDAEPLEKDVSDKKGWGKKPQRHTGVTHCLHPQHTPAQS